MKAHLVHLLLILLVTACAPPAAPTSVSHTTAQPTLPTPLVAPTQPPTTQAAPTLTAHPPNTPTSNPAATVPAATPTQALSFFDVKDDAPVLRHGDANAWDSKFIDPGAVVFHEGQFHMFYNGIAEWPRASIGYATSADGVNWTRAAGPLLKPADVPFGGIGIYAGSAHVEPDGTWALYFHTFESLDTWHGSIGRATAASSTGPWQVDLQPLLSPAGGNAWDAWRVVNPSVVKTDQGYTMYYEGVDAQSGVRRIGMATSPDGGAWTRMPNPVLDKSGGDAWDAEGVWDPNIVRTPDGMVMIYVSARNSPTYTNGFGIATSGLGLNWSRLADRPVLNTRDYTNWHEINNGALVYANGTMYLFAFVSTPDNETSDIWMATRRDRIRPDEANPWTFGVFEGRTPCAESIVEFMGHPAAECQRLKIKLSLFQDPASGMPTTYELKGTETARYGKWSIVRGTGRGVHATDPDAVIIQLDGDKPQSPLSLLNADDKVLLFLDRELNPMVGDAILSYTLSRDLGTTVPKNPPVAENMTPAPVESSMFPPGVFEGITPCSSVSTPLPAIPADTNCEQMIWKLTLHTDPGTQSPTTYELTAAYGLPQQNTTGLVNGGTKVAMQGVWRIVRGTKGDPEALVLQLDPEKPEESVYFQQVNDDILLLLDRELNLVVGNAAWSYTFNRTE